MSPWNIVNANLIAKSIGELCYEQILNVEVTGSGSYKLRLKSEASYTFDAWMGIWDHLKINPETLKKEGSNDLTAGQFFIDSQSELGMSDIVLGNFLEEMNNSLYADLALYEKQKNVSALEMTGWNGEKIQSYLNGHPKILLSKGRVGWGSVELSRYSPESEKPFKLFWIAVKKSEVECAFDDQFNGNTILAESFDSAELQLFQAVINENEITENEYFYLPVHPWQWDRFIKIQFQGAIANRKFIGLGLFGDDYLAQISIRTLRNCSRPKKLDIKLPLTILNTSAIRGIPAKYISVGPKLSRHLLGLCHEDALLKASGTDVLVEKAGMSVVHSEYTQIATAPYRYNEFLGAIWRESSEAKLEHDEVAVMTGCLFYQDHHKASLVGAYIQKSGLTKEEWLKKYFSVVVIPLYHLQLKYGVGLVAHGQNIVLKMKNFIPCGAILKDFQGDLRLSQNSILIERESFKDIAAKLDKLPANYLIHDLMTGHLVTVLRFVSEVMAESDQFNELDFYRILADVIEEYSNNNQVPAELNFLNQKMHRVLVNKVRFKIGYGDSSERPLPLVGTDLVNPLYLGLKSSEELNG